MENKFGLIDLTDKELREANGGAWPLLIIRIFMPSIKGINGFFEGLRGGYERTTPS